MTTTIINIGNRLYAAGDLRAADILKEMFSDYYNETYGAGNWLVIPTADLPDDFSVDTYTIENGQLVRSSAEVIAERKAAATLAYNEQQRQLREAEYRATTDPLVIDAIAESTPQIKALKDAIRAKHPYRS